MLLGIQFKINALFALSKPRRVGHAVHACRIVTLNFGMHSMPYSMVAVLKNPNRFKNRFVMQFEEYSVNSPKRWRSRGAVVACMARWHRRVGQANNSLPVIWQVRQTPFDVQSSLPIALPHHDVATSSRRLHCDKAVSIFLAVFSGRLP